MFAPATNLDRQVNAEWRAVDGGRSGEAAVLPAAGCAPWSSLGSGLIRSVQHLRLPVTCYPSPHTSHNHPVELMSPPCIDHISHIHSHLRLVTATCMCSLPLVFGRLVCPGPTQHSPTLFAPIHFCFSCQPSRLGLRPAQFTRAPTCGFSPPPICTLLLCDHFCGITAVAQR